MPNTNTVRSKVRIRMKRAVAQLEKSLLTVKEADEIMAGQSEMFSKAIPPFVVQLCGVIDFAKSILKEM